MNYPDVQSTTVTSFKLTRVGITGLRKPVTIQRPGRTVELHPEIDLFVDLPSHLKGSHMSRNAEIICEMIDTSIRTPDTSLEHLCAAIAGKLLERHEYATVAEITMSADYFLERPSPTGKMSLERFRIMARAVGVREPEEGGLAAPPGHPADPLAGDPMRHPVALTPDTPAESPMETDPPGTAPGHGMRISRSIGVEVTGMTACPCAMETTRSILQDEHRDMDLSRLLSISHNQRNISTLILEFPGESSVEADDLITLVEGSLSSPTHEILKRKDEALVVINAHRNPKFVEDVVRDILAKLLERYPHLPDGTIVTVRSESEESIHKHNAFAERVTTVRELKLS